MEFIQETNYRNRYRVKVIVIFIRYLADFIIISISKMFFYSFEIFRNIYKFKLFHCFLTISFCKKLLFMRTSFSRKKLFKKRFFGSTFHVTFSIISVTSCVSKKSFLEKHLSIKVVIEKSFPKKDILSEKGFV